MTMLTAPAARPTITLTRPASTPAPTNRLTSLTVVAAVGIGAARGGFASVSGVLAAPVDVTTDRQHAARLLTRTPYTLAVSGWETGPLSDPSALWELTTGGRVFYLTRHDVDTYARTGAFRHVTLTRGDGTTVTCQRDGVR